MKTIISVLVTAIFMISSTSYSQSGWYAQQSGTNAVLSDVNFINEYTGWAVGDSSYILNTTNGGQSWVKSKVNSSIRIFLRFVKFQNANTGYIGGGDQNTEIYGKKYLFKTTNQGLNWVLIKSDSSYSVYFYSSATIVNPDRFFLSTLNTVELFTLGYVQKSIDGGNTFSSTGTFNGGPISQSFINENTGWLCSRVSSDMINLNRSYIYRTTNSGVSWENLLCDTIYKNFINELTFANSQTGFALSTYYNQGYESTRFYRTTNGGVSWDTSGYRSFGKSNSICAINENTVFIGGSNGSDTSMIAKTTNAGTTWDLQYKRHTGYIANFCFLNSMTGYSVGGNGLIIKTTNGGVTMVNEISSEVPEKYELGQNYPNPFNQSTIFNLQCSMKSDVCVKVFDAAGREVQTLVNETLAPGTYQVRFDGSGLASGVYYYKLSINSEGKSVRKMVLIK